MRNRKKVILASIICFALILGWFFSTHSTYYKYNDKWIIGLHIEEVEKRYGKFDDKDEGLRMVGYYIYTDDGLIMPSHLKMYYWMEYDEKGIVIKVAVEGPRGG